MRVCVFSRCASTGLVDLSHGGLREQETARRRSARFGNGSPPLLWSGVEGSWPCTRFRIGGLKCRSEVTSPSLSSSRQPFVSGHGADAEPALPGAGITLASGTLMFDRAMPLVYSEPTVMWRMRRGDGLMSHAVIGPHSDGPMVVWFIND